MAKNTNNTGILYKMLTNNYRLFHRNSNNLENTLFQSLAPKRKTMFRVKQSRKYLPVEAKEIVKSVYLKLVEQGQEKYFTLKMRSAISKSTVWKIIYNTVRPLLNTVVHHGCNIKCTNTNFQRILHHLGLLVKKI